MEYFSKILRQLKKMMIFSFRRGIQGLMKINKSIVLYFFLFLLVFVFAVGIFLWVTDNGVGISADSTVYIETAVNLLKGKGFYARGEPMTFYPPVYPILLAISGSFGSNVADSARWLHALLYGVNAILLGLSIFVFTRRNLPATLIGIILFFSSKAVLTIHSYAWSEPPFITFLLISFLLFSFYISTKRWLLLILSSISLGLAITTRYVGITLLPPIVLCIFLFIKEPIKHKMKVLITTTILAGTPMAFWLIHNLLAAPSSNIRNFIYNPISLEKIKILILTLHSFIQSIIFPDSSSIIIYTIDLILIICILLFILFVLYKNQEVFNHSNSSAKVFISLGVVFSPIYILMLLATILFFDTATSFDERFLLPMYIISIISVILMVFWFSEILKKQSVWLLFIVCVLFTVRANLLSTTNLAIKSNEDGIGYNSRIWNESPTVSMLKSSNPKSDIIIFSNGYDFLRYKTGFDVIPLPISKSYIALVVNPSYDKQVLSMCDLVESGNAMIVYLDAIPNRTFFPTEEELQKKCNLPILADTKDGTIYGIKGN